MASQWIRARQTKYAAYATVYIVIVIAALVVANVLADRYNRSYDATANKRYSLSDQTRRIVQGLKQDASISYFNQSTRFQQGKDLLDQYANLSSKVHVEYVDIDKNPQLTRAAGVRNYGTAIVRVGDRKEEAPSMTEEGITGAFLRVLKGGTRTVCFVAGSGEHQLGNNDRDGLSRLKSLLTRDNYQSMTIDLLQKAEVPADCTALVIAGPTRNYEQPEVDAIKKYVEDGGRSLFMLDPPLKTGPLAIADNDALTALLQSWGVTPQKNLIVDLNPIGQLAGVGPTVALVTSYSSQAIVNGMKGIATGFPLARSLEIKDTGKTNVQKLFDSSSSSLATSNLSAASVNANDPHNQHGPLPLAAAGTYTTGKPNGQGRFVVFGNSAWAANGFIDFNGNNDLALNTINWLSSDEDMISIRPKPPEDSRITMTRGQLTWVSSASQFLLPLVVTAFGLSMWWKLKIAP